MKKNKKAKYNYDVMIFIFVFLLIIIFTAFFFKWSLFFLFLGIFLPVSFLLYLLYTLFPFGKVQYWQGNKKLLRERLEQDWEKLWKYQEALDETLKEMQARELEKGRILRDEGERRYWKENWEKSLDYLMALNTLTLRYQDFYLLNYYEDRELHAWSFLLAYLAFLYQYETILRIVDLADTNDDLKEFFNSSDYFKDWKLAVFDELSFSLTKWENLLRWRIGNLYFRYLRYKGFFVYPIFKKRGKGFIKSVYRLHKELKKKIRHRKKLFFINPFRFLRNYGFALWYPIQKNVARGVSFVRLTERDNLISFQQIEELRQLLEPGDIMVERRNWFLTNIGIPGFWPHAALYLGNFKVFLAYFKELEDDLGETVENYLEKNFKKFYKNYKNDEFAVIESVRDGVVLKTLAESAYADYWAVMRPRLSKIEKFRALIWAISNWGKSYDYKFDFRGEDSLVCSELVYKSYMPSEQSRGLSFVLEEMGTNVFLSPNSMVKKFDEEYGSADQELDFVLFLDGNEEQQLAVRKDVNEFRNSWQRTKWDIMQE